MMLQRTRKLSTLLLASGALLLARDARAQAPALPQVAVQRSNQILVEPWPGQRVVLLLPLQLGPGWNADRAMGELLLPIAEQDLADDLERTGKFSVIQGHRFNPLLRRAVLENRLTEEQVKSFTQAPSLENARELLSKFEFDQSPMIAEFFLEEVRSTSFKKRRSVTVQVTGRLYNLDGPALSNIVLSSDPVTRGGTAIEQVLQAADNAFTQIAAQFVQPVADFALPVMEPAPAPAAPTPDALPSLTGQPGGLLPPGTTPQLPPAQPPLGITAPAQAH